MDSFRGNNAYDRLSALRQSAPMPVQSQHSKSRLLLFIAVGIVAVLVAAAMFVVRGAPGIAPEEIVDVLAEQAPVVPNSDTLLDGEAYIAIAADVGTFPPSLSPGDTVQVVVAPNVNSEGIARLLAEQGVVREVRPPSEFGNTFVITIRASQSVAAEIIDAEKVHLSVINEAAS